MKSRMLRYCELLLLVVFTLALAACSPKGQTPAAATVQPATQTNSQAAGQTALPPVKSSSSVMAEGKVVPAQDASLSVATGGVVDQVLVKEGDKVQANQTLIRLKGNERLESAISAAELELLTAQQAIQDLNDNSGVARAQAQQTLALAQKELDKAQKRIYSKDYQRGSSSQVDTARANYIIAEDAVKKAEELYDKMRDRAQDDPVRAEAFSQVAAARQKRDTALANLNYLLEKPSQLDVDEVNANLAVAQAKTADAQRRLELLKNGPDANQMALAQARLKNAQVSLKAAQAALTDLELRAPFAGTISTVDITAGEMAAPGTPVVSMADFSNWQVETTDLTELNIARIKVGQPAMVRFDALPGVDTIGRVTQIKAQGENRQGDVVYTVVLKLDNPDERLRWNMTASVTFLEKDAAQ